jgi:hypothetical protein
MLLYRHMLTHRTNVLFEHQDYLELTRLSREQGVTMGELVRKAVKAQYGLSKSGAGYRRQLAEEIREGWKYLKNPEIPMNYKELVNEGRRF